MEININQKKITIGDKYQIFIDGQQTHAAAAKFFRLFPEINLVELNSSSTVITLKKKFALFVAKYDITRLDNSFLEFKTKSFWKSHFECVSGTDTYDIYGHRGRKYSVYKNNTQVAWWDKKAVTWFNGDNYTIIANNNCDYNLIISFCLIVDNYKSNDSEKSTLNIDVGRIGPQAKKFDPSWEPNYL